MKRGKKLLVMLLALAVLCGMTAILTGLDLNRAEETVDTSVTMMTLDAASVTALAWENLQETPLSFTITDGQWIYDDDPAFPLDTAMLETMTDTLSQIVASRAIEEPADPAEYGLNEPLCTVTVTAGSETWQVDLGDETGLGGECYASIGDGKVYLVDLSLLDSFDYVLYDLVQEETLPDLSTVTGLTIDAEIQRLEIRYLENSGLAYSDAYTWFLQEDGGCTALDTELVEDLLAVFQDMYWEDCVNYRADEAALEEYGLADPMAVVTLDHTDDGADGSLTLELGSYTATGDIYARIAGSGMVYTVDADVSDAALYTTADALLPDEVLALDFEEVTAVDILLDGVTHTVQVEIRSEADDEGNVTEKTIYTLNGQQVYLSDTIALLEDLNSNGYATGMIPERSLEIGFVFYRNDENYPAVALDLYQYDSGRCIVQLQGESTVFALREEIVALIEEVRTVVSD